MKEQYLSRDSTYPSLGQYSKNIYAWREEENRIVSRRNPVGPDVGALPNAGFSPHVGMGGIPTVSRPEPPCTRVPESRCTSKILDHSPSERSRRHVFGNSLTESRLMIIAHLFGVARRRK